MIRDIALIGEDVLYRKAADVSNAGSERIRRIAEDMRDTLRSIDAIAMAAPQIGALDRLFIFHLPARRIPAGARTSPVPWTVAVNPVIDPLTEMRQFLWERCLSIPGLFGRVSRPAAIRMRYQDLDGVHHEMIASGFLANVLQHETDHLNGVLFTMRLVSGTDLAADKVVCGNGRFYPYAAAEFDGPAGDGSRRTMDQPNTGG